MQHRVHAVRGTARRGRRRRRAHDRHAADERRRRQEAEGVEGVTDVRPERGDERSRGRGADDAHAHHRELHERVGGHQAVGRDVAADRHRLRRREERGNDAEHAEDRVDLPHRRRDEEQADEPCPGQIARHERRLQRPPVHEHPRQRPEQREREHVGDLHAGDLRRRPVQPERYDRDHREERQEVAEQADDLRVPHAPHDGDLEDLLERQRRWGRRHRGAEILSQASQGRSLGDGVSETESRRRRERR